MGVRSRLRCGKCEDGGGSKVAKETGDGAVKKIKAAEKIVVHTYSVLNGISGKCNASWMAKKASFRKTFKIQAETNDNVWSLKMRTWRRLWYCWLRVMNVLRRPTKEFCDIDQKFDVEFDQLQVYVTSSFGLVYTRPPQGLMFWAPFPSLSFLQ